MRTRKLIGTIILIVLLVCWVFLGLALAPLAFSSSSEFAPAVFYFVAGLGWLVIAMPSSNGCPGPTPRREGAARRGAAVA
jgi:hypothetical protein